MALMRMQFQCQAIRKQTNMTVILPDDAESDGPFPVLYLLHGYSDDDTIWTRRTSLERYLAGMPLIVVMPDGAHSFYTDAQEGLPYETHVMETVIGLTEKFFPVVRERSGRCIGGLSMGGFGSMKLALKHPDMFCSVVSHSGLFDVSWLVNREERGAESIRTFGADPAGGPEDILRLAEEIDRGLLPAIRFDCGVDDGLIEENRKFHAHLDKLGIPHEYEEFPGAHNWEYWDTHIREALAFHAAALGI